MDYAKQDRCPFPLMNSFDSFRLVAFCRTTVPMCRSFLPSAAAAITRELQAGQACYYHKVVLKNKACSFSIPYHQMPILPSPYSQNIGRNNCFVFAFTIIALGRFAGFGNNNKTTFSTCRSQS